MSRFADYRNLALLTIRLVIISVFVRKRLDMDVNRAAVHVVRGYLTVTSTGSNILNL